MGNQLINFLTTVEQFKSTKCSIHVHYIYLLLLPYCAIFVEQVGIFGS